MITSPILCLYRILPQCDTPRPPYHVLDVTVWRLIISWTPPPPPPALSLDGWYRRNVIKRSNMTFALTALRLLNWRCPKQSGACVYARFLSPNNNNCGDDSVLWCVDLLAKLSKSEYGLYHKVSAACTGTRITLACLEKRQTRPTKENSVRCDWIVIVPQQTTFPN